MVRTLLVVLVTAAFVVTFAAVLLHEQWGIVVGGDRADGASRDTPLGRPSDVHRAAGSFAFLAHQPGRPDIPVAYDPCEPVRVRVNDRLAPPDGAVIVREALARAATATGLQFLDEGTTDALPKISGGISPVGPAGDAVLVAWTTPEQQPALEGDVAGVGGSTSVTDAATGTRRYVTGAIALDAPDLTAMLLHPGGRSQVRALVMHELGHVVGLDHVRDPHELMNGDNVAVTEFGPGDREGLAALGSGRCPR